METTKNKKEEKFPVDVYIEKMKDIKFMEPFLSDTDVFNPDSEKFKDFLLQSFSHLHSDFHQISYLPLLSKKDIDQELVKASQILQILPGNSLKKREKLFGTMTKTEIHSFWLRFFNLFLIKKDDKQSNSNTKPSHVLSEKLDFLKNIHDTLNYINYDFPVFNVKKLKNIDVDKEIKKWDAEQLLNTIVENEPSVIKSEPNKIDKVFVEKLIIDLKQILSIYNNISLTNGKDNLAYDEFFENFVGLTKNILKYKNDITFIDSSFTKDLSMQISQENVSTSNIYFLKNLNNLIETLKTRIKNLN